MNTKWTIFKLHKKILLNNSLNIYIFYYKKDVIKKLGTLDLENNNINVNKALSSHYLNKQKWDSRSYVKVTVKARELCYNKSSHGKTSEPVDIKQIEDEYKMNDL